MSRTDILKAQISKLRQELHQIEAAETIKRNKPLVGRFYKCRNNYSLPEKESDYWWIYVAITGMDVDGDLKSVNFQTDKYGNIRTQKEDMTGSHYMEVEITKGEFDSAFATMIADIGSTFESVP